MTADVDEGLTWGDEKDPTHVDAAGPREPAAPAEIVEQTGSALLITYGVFAGVFLLYAVGWIIAINNIGLPVEGVLPQAMYRLGEGLAVAAPVIWFLGVLLLTRNARVGVRILWFLLGIVVTAPWPFILGGLK
jgi:hypothetical protein